MNRCFNILLVVLISAFTIHILPINATNNEVDLVVPSTLTITFNEDETTSISDFMIQNNTKYPINLTSLEITSHSDWQLSDSQSLHPDAHHLHLSLDNQTLLEGNNPLNTLIESQTELNFHASSGIYTESKSYNQVFSFTFHYDVLIKKYNLTLLDDTSTTLEIEEDSFYVLPNLNKEGYIFQGWIDSRTNTLYEPLSQYQMPSSNTTLKATWTLEEYLITYHLDGGHFEEDVPTTFTINSNSIQVPQPIKEGYRFAGWISDDNSEPILDYIIASGSTHSKVLTATWKSSITLLLDPFGNETIPAANPLPTPTKEGYVFEGWYYTKEVTQMPLEYFSTVPGYYDWVYNEGVFSSTNQGIKNSSSNMVSEVFVLDAPATLTFEYRTNGENSYDYLAYDFYCIHENRWMSRTQFPKHNSCFRHFKGCASTEFATETVELDPGTYQLMFMYGKDKSTNKNEDAAFVKNIYLTVESYYATAERYEGDFPDGELTLVAKWTPINCTYTIQAKSTTGEILNTTTMTHPYGTTQLYQPIEISGYTTPVYQMITYDALEKTVTVLYTAE